MHIYVHVIVVCTPCTTSFDFELPEFPSTSILLEVSTFEGVFFLFSYNMYTCNLLQVVTSHV